ncbi:scavenger receptor cysteine-rich type 1 protein M130-like isoform X2 [Scomber scombrus]|uniref:Scavenger receptor cysteine-rich type 1 protein M130-like isoform X2 n=1 Tax=Scomber scombrus TaxID=13677 RepID=A0AAV1Q8R7_SCOSC
MDHLLMLLLLLWSSGLQTEGKHQSPGSQCDSKADIVMLVDGSWSIGRLNFQTLRSFLRKIVNIVDIGPDKVQIGLVQFSGDPKTEWELNTHQTNQSLLEAITKLPYKGGNTMTGIALQLVLHYNFKPNVGMRADSQKIIILITDGESQDNVSLASDHLRDSGIEIYAIGVKDADKSQLLEITANPAHVYMVDDFNGLQRIVNDLIINICANSSLDGFLGSPSNCYGAFPLHSFSPSRLDSARFLFHYKKVPTQRGRGRHSTAPRNCRDFVFIRDTKHKQWRTLRRWCTCCYSVRLVNGTSLCSGRLEVKSEQSWSSVCEADFDQQDAEVVCRELGCGAPSVLQGALYGEVEAPMWTKQFQCGGHESALLDCRRSDSARRTCSPGKAVGLTCSEPVRLVGGASRCAGRLEMKQTAWRPVSYSDWTLKEAAVACSDLDCGSAVSTRSINNSLDRSVWWISSECVQSGYALRDCASSDSSSSIVELICSDSVRLVNGTSLCSGRLEVKSEQSWSSVCEADFDQQDAEVVCRELDCGTPLVLQGALYGEVEAPMWTKEFQCGGNESALLDCRRSDSARRTCSPGKAVGLTCSDPVRLVGGASRCAGTLEMKYGEWRPCD